MNIQTPAHFFLNGDEQRTAQSLDKKLQNQCYRLMRICVVVIMLTGIGIFLMDNRSPLCLLPLIPCLAAMICIKRRKNNLTALHDHAIQLLLDIADNRIELETVSAEHEPFGIRGVTAHRDPTQPHKFQMAVTTMSGRFVAVGNRLDLDGIFWAQVFSNNDPYNDVVYTVESNEDALELMREFENLFDRFYANTPLT